MAFELRPYQVDLIDRARSALGRVDSVMIQSAVGSGKTALSAYMLGRTAARGHRSAFVCHRQEILDQTAETFEQVGIPFGIIAAGHRPNPMLPVQICSIDTLKVRMEKLDPFKLMIFDEAHHCSAAGWTKVKNFYKGSKSVGLSATPKRLDRKGLDHLFDEMICGPSVQWLIENGYLSKYRIFCGAEPDLTGLAERAGDYAMEDLGLRMDKSQITGDAINEYKRWAMGKRAVAFCSGIAHSKHVVQAFLEAGIAAEHIDGSTERSERKGAVDRFRRGETLVLSNVDLVGEGFNLPAIEASILLRPTQSLSLYIQQIGRCMRPAPGKDYAIILDHAGNLKKHGLPCDDREWSLKAERKKKKAVEIRTRECPECGGTHPIAAKCPYCGFVYETARAALAIDNDAQLVEVDVVAMRARKRMEESACKSYAEFVALGKQRGYKKGWAHYRWEDYQKKHPAVRLSSI